jgi:hypothetical protein
MRRTLSAVALTAALVTTAPPGLFDRLWTLLSPVWPAWKAGCEGDPNGMCSPAPRPQTEAGCEWDPNGMCNPTPQPRTEAGCEADPSGMCNPGS